MLAGRSRGNRSLPVAALVVAGLALVLRPRLRRRVALPAARRLDAGAATLAFSVLADSALEHYRGGLYNPAMFVAPAVAATTLATAATGPRRAGGPLRASVFGTAAVVGVVGFGFHLYNISRRVGGWRWNSLFYGAPIGAPVALSLAGLLGLAGAHLGRGAGRALGFGVSAALLGTAAEAALLHFRGAFHSRYMYLPVTVPPAAALALAGAAASSAPAARRFARLLLRVTALLGFAGTAFHARGVARNMGGWRNWTQNLQAGPPLPAPPSFTGLALAGLAALDLLAEESTR